MTRRVGELLLHDAAWHLRVEARLVRDAAIHAPHLLDVEVVQALRRLVRMRELSVARAGEAIEDLAGMDLHRHPHVDLVDRAWGLRETSRRTTRCTWRWPRRSTHRSSPAMARSERRPPPFQESFGGPGGDTPRAST